MIATRTPPPLFPTDLARIERALERGASAFALLDVLGLEVRAFLPHNGPDEAEPACSVPLDGRREAWVPLADPASPTFRRAVLRAACIAAAMARALNRGDGAALAPSGLFAWAEGALAAARVLEAVHGLPGAPREHEAARCAVLLEEGRAYVRAALAEHVGGEELGDEVCA